MSYKTRLSWLGWVLVAPLVAVDLATFALMVLKAWTDLSNGAPEASTVGPQSEWLRELFSVVVLLNLALLPFVLLSLRLKRTHDYR